MGRSDGAAGPGDDVPPGARPETFADLLDRGRAGRFVGREHECEVFRRVVAREDEARLLWVHGPGGVGKTTLLGAFLRISHHAGLAAARVDLRSIDPTPDAFAGELAARTGADDPGPSVVMVDTFERAGALETWMREKWLPALPAGSTTVVLAGREPPSSPWRDAGWHGLLRELRLRNFTPAEAERYLAAAGVAADRHPEVAQVTHGHPLALSLAAELSREDGGWGTGGLDRAPDIVAHLVQRLVEAVPSPLHRRALEVCAHAWVTGEDLLRDVLAVDDAHELVGWLRGLSIIEEGPYGLYPHDLARDVVDADLRWRDPSGYAELHRRVQRVSIDRAGRLTGTDQQRAISTVVHSHRRNAATSSFWRYDELGSVYADVLRAGDADRLEAMINRHHGRPQADLVRYWLERQPHAFRVVRGTGPEALGFAALLRLDLVEQADLERDPAVEAVWRAIEQRRPLRPGEHATLMRWMVDEEHNQAPSRTLNLGPVLTIQNLIRDPAIAWDVLCWIDTGDLDPLMEFIDYRRLPEADHRLGDLAYATFARDFRGSDLADWLDLLAGRELGEPPTTGQVSENLLALSFPEFADSVRAALKDLSRPDRLSSNPLCKSRLVRGGDEQPEPTTRLRAVIEECVAEFDAHPREAPYGRALHRTYLRPAPTQEAAAEVLGLPFSTYRRHLTRGVERLVEKLWRREVALPGDPSTPDPKVSRKRSGE